MREFIFQVRLIDRRDIGAALFVGFVLAVCAYACW